MLLTFKTKDSILVVNTEKKNVKFAVVRDERIISLHSSYLSAMKKHSWCSGSELIHCSNN